MIYEKDNKKIIVNDKFIYRISTYALWKRGACLIDEQFYSINKPLKFKKKQLQSKRKDHILQRYLDLEYAPEKWLNEQGWKPINKI